MKHLLALSLLAAGTLAHGQIVTDTFSQGTPIPKMMSRPST